MGNDNSDTEIWKNPNLGPRYVKTYDHEGKLTSTVIRPGKTLALTTKERFINQDIAASEELDMFKNGGLVPVTLVESASDYNEIVSNPNLIGESEMASLFDLKIGDFRERLSVITNMAALGRISDLADATDSSSYQVKAIAARIKELSPPDPDLVSADDIEAGNAIKAVKPR